MSSNEKPGEYQPQPQDAYSPPPVHPAHTDSGVAHDPHASNMAADPYQQQQQQQQQQQFQQPQAQPPMQPVPQISAGPMGPKTAYGRKGGKWEASLCNCTPCTSCLLSCCLPCLLVGQTSERIRDPSGQTENMLNNDCIIHGVICTFTGCGWIYTMLKRGEIRERYQIEGSTCKDCCTSFWCHCCAVIQHDNEVKKRQAAGEPDTQGYQAQTGMQVPAPAYQQ